jgi:hypothetical protein
MNVIAISTQGCSGAVVEYLLLNLKVECSRPHCAQILFCYTAENSGGAENSTESSGLHAKNFFALCTNLVYDIRSGYRKLTSSLVTV